MLNGVNGYSAGFASFQLNTSYNNAGMGQFQPSVAPSFLQNSYMADSFSQGPALGSNFMADMSMMRTQGFQQDVNQAKSLSAQGAGGGIFQGLQQMLSTASQLLQSVLGNAAPGAGSAGALPQPSANAMGQAQAPQQTLPQTPAQAAPAKKKKKGGLFGKLLGGLKKGLGGIGDIVKKGLGGLGGILGKGGGIGGLLGGLLGGGDKGGGLLGGLLGGGDKGGGGGLGNILGGLLGGGDKGGGGGGLGGILGGLLGGGGGGGLGGILGGVAKVAGPLLGAL